MSAMQAGPERAKCPECNGLFIKEMGTALCDVAPYISDDVAKILCCSDTCADAHCYKVVFGEDPRRNGI